MKWFFININIVIDQNDHLMMIVLPYDARRSLGPGTTNEPSVQEWRHPDTHACAGRTDGKRGGLYRCGAHVRVGAMETWRAFPKNKQVGLDRWKRNRRPEVPDMKRGHREIFHIVSSSKSVLECRKGLGRYRVVFEHGGLKGKLKIFVRNIR